MTDKPEEPSLGELARRLEEALRGPNQQSRKDDPLADQLGIPRDTRSEAERVADTQQRYLEYQRSTTQQPPQENLAPEPPKKSDFWTHADKAMFGVCEMLALLFGLPFGDDLYHDKPLSSIGGWHWFYLGIAIVFAVAGPMWPWLRTRPWAPQAAVTVLSRVAVNPYVWLAALFALFFYGAGPEMYQRATAPVPSSSAGGPVLPSPIPAPPPPSKPLIQPGQSLLTGSQVVEEVKNLRSQVDDLKRQNDALRDAQKNMLVVGTPPPQQQAPSAGPITWDSQLTTWTSGDLNGTLFLGIGIRGKANALVELTNASIDSELTGEKQTLQVSIAPGPRLVPISSINQIPPGASIELWATFNPPIHGADLLERWGRFRLRAEYSGGNYDKVFDEDFMRKFVGQFPGSNIGPHVTTKAPSK